MTELTFGIYPGGVTGTDAREEYLGQGYLATGPDDDPARITAALNRLQGRPGRPFRVRAYLPFNDDTASGAQPTATPADARRYAVDGRRLELVAQYQSATGNTDGYCGFVRELVEQYGETIDLLQIAEEPTMTDMPILDGYFPGVREAIVRGVAAAKERAHELGFAHLRVGFNFTPLYGPAASFLSEMAELGGAEFIEQLDYVGLDFFPDVFHPVAAEDMPRAVEGLLRHHRSLLNEAGFGAIPLHIAENGWPTGPDRTPQRQAEVVSTVVEQVAALAEELNITGYTHFALRDADSANPDLFHQFGIMTDDYTPKPAFDTLCGLIEKFGR
ncbi:hypothetical protein [Nocardia arthritidis]|uniref:TIM barrel protein n=1 Tax=Nocardia arthritidis TaxID=228602 RepID=A0A6G9YE78_9NOCA|nr:hypothetical protein [Nocardia arthritidis]QIS11430.1 hypothetical protein F5544_17775 [Nocardia arthritidis]